MPADEENEERPSGNHPDQPARPRVPLEVGVGVLVERLERKLALGRAKLHGGRSATEEGAAHEARREDET